MNVKDFGFGVSCPASRTWILGFRGSQALLCGDSPVQSLKALSTKSAAKKKGGSMQMSMVFSQQQVY